MRVLSVRKIEDWDYEIKVSVTIGMWWWKKTFTRTYRGDCTVWHCVEARRRASIFMEGRLYDALRAWRYDQEKANS